MTPDKTPTDADLTALLLAHLPASKHYIEPVKAKIIAAMQAAVAKWGSPVLAVEPVAEHYRNAIAVACEGWTMPDGLRKHLEQALWSQPTQAQAGAVPLTDNELNRRSRIGAIHTEPGDKVVLRSGAYRAQMEDRFKRGWREAEKHHSIKGGR